jgi:hypothetical protein
MLTNELKEALIFSDPASHIVSRKWHWPLWLPPVLTVLWASIGLFYVAWLFGYIYGNKQIYGTLDVPSELAVALIFQPIIVWYHFSFSLRIVKMLDGLIENGVISTKEYSQFEIQVKEIANSYSSKVFFFICLAFSLGITIWVTIFAFELKLGYPFWMHSLKWPFLIFQVPQSFLVTYSATYTVFRISVLHYRLSNILNSITINVQPLHSDGAGGLSPIGQLVGSYLYWLLAASIFVTHSGWAAYFQYGKFPAYVILQFILLPFLVLLAFFIPLLSTHAAMQRNKQKALEKFNVEFSKKFILLGKKDTDNNLYKEINDIIDTSKRIRSNFPVWPFNTSVIQNVSISIIASFLPLVFSLVEKYFNKFLP